MAEPVQIMCLDKLCGFYSIIKWHGGLSKFLRQLYRVKDINCSGMRENELCSSCDNSVSGASGHWEANPNCDDVMMPAKWLRWMQCIADFAPTKDCFLLVPIKRDHHVPPLHLLSPCDFLPVFFPAEVFNACQEHQGTVLPYRRPGVITATAPRMSLREILASCQKTDIDKNKTKPLEEIRTEDIDQTDKANMLRKKQQGMRRDISFTGDAIEDILAKKNDPCNDIKPQKKSNDSCVDIGGSKPKGSCGSDNKPQKKSNDSCVDIPSIKDGGSKPKGSCGDIKPQKKSNDSCVDIASIRESGSKSKGSCNDNDDDDEDPCSRKGKGMSRSVEMFKRKARLSRDKYKLDHCRKNKITWGKDKQEKPKPQKCT